MLARYLRPSLARPPTEITRSKLVGRQPCELTFRSLKHTMRTPSSSIPKSPTLTLARTHRRASVVIRCCCMATVDCMVTVACMFGLACNVSSDAFVLGVLVETLRSSEGLGNKTNRAPYITRQSANDVPSVSLEDRLACASPGRGRQILSPKCFKFNQRRRWCALVDGLY